jgi:hypothetical protein
MKIIRNAIAAGLIAAATVVAACSSQHGATSTGNSNTSPVGNTATSASSLGSVKMAWTVPPGVTVTNLNWTLTGAPATQVSGFTYSGSVPIGSAMSAEWVAGGIVAGCGYTLNVTAVDQNQDPCTGTATGICIAAGIVTYTQISVVCQLPNDAAVATVPDTGSLAVEAGITASTVDASVCPAISSFSIAPAELLGTQPALLQVVSTQAITVNPPANGISIQWTAGPCNAAAGLLGTGTVGGFTKVGFPGDPDSTDPQVNFSCGTCNGQVAITATLNDFETLINGTDANICPSSQYPTTTMTGLINCEGGGVLQCNSAPDTTECPGTGTPPVPYCADTTSDPSNCGAGVLGCGVVCASPTTTCKAGVCACPNNGVPSDGICCPVGQTASGTPPFCCAAGSASCTASTCQDITSDPLNCGGCGTKCSGGTPNCSNSHCVSAPLTICTSGTCNTATQVTCPNETGGVCTQTEAAFIQLDINSNVITGAGPAYTGNPSKAGPTCLSCLVASSCVDNPAHAIKLRECDDFTGSFTAGDGNVSTKNAACLATLNCMIGTTGMSCAANAAGDSFCYCGLGGFAGVGPSSCTGTNDTAVNGSCLTQEANGFTYPEFDALDIGNNFTDISGANPSGIANQILTCAQGNNCNSCLQ